MPITFRCECGKAVRVPDEAARKIGRCPYCGQKVRIPKASGPIKPISSEDRHPGKEQSTKGDAQCWSCKHRLANEVCDNNQSPEFGQKVSSAHFCPEYLKSAGMKMFCEGIDYIAGTTGSEDPPEVRPRKIASLMQKAIDLGLPQCEGVYAILS